MKTSETIYPTDGKALTGDLSKTPAILFLDDEPHILNALRRLFRGFENWEFYFANSPADALQIISTNHIHVLVADHKMPQMTGAEFLARLKEKRPNMIRIMLTGQAGLDDVKKAVNDGDIYKFILKPWDDEELKQTIKGAVQFYRIAEDSRQLTSIMGGHNEQLVELNTRLEDKVKTRNQQLEDSLYTAQTLNLSLQESLYATGKTFFNIVELASPEIGSHSRRVAIHATRVGGRLGLKKREILELEIAALLHDVGKIGIPKFILEKSPKDLMSEERNIYESHPLAGAESLKPILGYEQICEYIRRHHERFNGTGFPNRQKKGEVPTGAYLIGLANEYDHMLNTPNTGWKYTYEHRYQTIADYADREFPKPLVEIFLPYIEEIAGQETSAVETRVSINDLVTKMYLSRDIYTMSGTLLAAAGTVLTRQYIHRIRSIARVDQIAGNIFVTKAPL